MPTPIKAMAKNMAAKLSPSSTANSAQAPLVAVVPEVPDLEEEQVAEVEVELAREDREAQEVPDLEPDLQALVLRSGVSVVELVGQDQLLALAHTLASISILTTLNASKCWIPGKAMVGRLNIG
jgi:hypothetical protein